MPSIGPEVLNNLDTSIPRQVIGFPSCEICKRRVRNPIAGTNGFEWFFGHVQCVPRKYWMAGEDFQSLEQVLDWAYHLSEKLVLGRESWLRVVEYVRPQWSAAAREVMHRFFTAQQHESAS